MTEQAETELSCGEHGRGGPWYPQRKWWQSSRLFNQDVGLPPFLEPGDPWWMNVEWLQRSLAASAWPGCIPAPLFVPHISGSMHHPSQKISKEQFKWRVTLDVAHFSPSEIWLSVKDGFLEVGGKHEERPDEHGFIARCFKRKYRLPAEIDATKITSTLSVDGILTVEAPVPETSVPETIIIPIKIEVEAAAEQEEPEKEETPEPEPEDSGVPEAPEIMSVEDHGVEAPLQLHGDEAHPGSAADGAHQQEERREQEEAAGESHPSLSADDGKDTEDSSEHCECLESQESPDTDKPRQPDQEEPAMDAEVQVMAGSEETAEEPQLSEFPSQEPQAHDIKQEHTK